MNVLKVVLVFSERLRDHKFLVGSDKTKKKVVKTFISLMKIKYRGKLVQTSKKVEEMMGVRGLGNKMKFKVIFVEKNLVYSWIDNKSCVEYWGKDRKYKIKLYNLITGQFTNDV